MAATHAAGEMVHVCTWRLYVCRTNAGQIPVALRRWAGLLCTVCAQLGNRTVSHWPPISTGKANRRAEPRAVPAGLTAAQLRTSLPRAEGTAQQRHHSPGGFVDAHGGARSMELPFTFIISSASPWGVTMYSDSSRLSVTTTSAFRSST